MTYTEEHIEKEDLMTFKKIQKVIKKINPKIPDELVNDNGKNIIISCHMVAKAIAQVFCLQQKRGYYLPGYEHSWLVTKYGNIIDVYPWGTVGGPLLITRKILSTYGPLYVESSEKLADSIPEQTFDKCVDIIENSIWHSLS